MKRRFRSSLLVSVCISVLLLSETKDATALGLPVVDLPALADWAQKLQNDIKAYALQLEQYTVQAKQWATQNLQWAEQIKQYALQGQQYLQEIMLYDNFFHNPTLTGAMGLIGNAGLGNGLPVNSFALMGLVNGFTSFTTGHGNNFGAIAGILNSLSNLSSQVWAANHIYTPTDGSWESQQVIARADAIAAAGGMARQAYDDVHAHGAVIPALQADANAAQDTKSQIDVIAATQIQTLWHLNTLAENEAAFDAFQAQRAALQQREDEKLNQDITEALANSPVRDIVPVDMGAH
jgi:hypothetical protein